MSLAGMSDRDLHAAKTDPTLTAEERAAVLAEIDRRQAVDSVARNAGATSRTASALRGIGLGAALVALVAFAGLAIASAGGAFSPTRSSRVDAATAASTNAATTRPGEPWAQWTQKVDTSPMDGSRSVLFTKPSDLEESMRTNGEAETAWLDVRCKSGKTEAYVSFEHVLGNGGEISETPIRFRFDSAPAVRQEWDESTDYEAAFAPSPVAFLKRAATAKQLHIEFNVFDGPDRVVAFDLAGIDTVVSAIARECKWSPAHKPE